MVGYILVKNGFYQDLKIDVGYTYNLVQGTNFFKFYEKPNDIPMSYNMTGIEVYEIETNNPTTDYNSYIVSKKTNKFTVVKKIEPSGYNMFFSDYKFDDNGLLIENRWTSYIYNEKGNIINVKIGNEITATYEYDDNNNLIHYKSDGNYEEWYEFDEKNNLIHFKDSFVTEEFYDYDEKNNMIHSKFLPSKMEIWNTYDENNRLIYQKNSDGDEKFAQYDPNGNLINFKNGMDYEFNRVYDECGSLLKHDDKKVNESYEFSITNEN